MARTKKAYRQSRVDPVTRFFRWILRVQRRWAFALSRRTHHWGKREKIVFLVVISVAFSASSISILINAFSPGKGGGKPYDPGQMVMPVAPYSREKTSPRFTPADTQAVHEFYRIVDSLQQTPEGRAEYEQFLRERPGFLDSLHFLEQAMRNDFY